MPAAQGFLGDRTRERGLTGPGWAFDHQVLGLVAHRKAPLGAAFVGDRTGHLPFDLLFDIGHADELGQFGVRLGVQFGPPASAELAHEVLSPGSVDASQ